MVVVSWIFMFTDVSNQMKGSFSRQIHALFSKFKWRQVIFRGFTCLAVLVSDMIRCWHWYGICVGYIIWSVEHVKVCEQRREKRGRKWCKVCIVCGSNNCVYVTLYWFSLWCYLCFFFHFLICFFFLCTTKKKFFAWALK